MLIQTLRYKPELFEKWCRGRLARQWFRKHQRTFDKDDLRITDRQRRGHFGEWFVAIHYAERGFGVLVEKYIYKNHSRKARILSEKLSSGQIDFLRRGARPWHQPPDLFVYKGEKYFFVEVKKDGDRLGRSQEQWFRKIERKLNCGVTVCYLIKEV